MKNCITSFNAAIFLVVVMCIGTSSFSVGSDKNSNVANNRRSFLTKAVPSILIGSTQLVVTPSQSSAVDYATSTPTEKAATSAGRRGCKTVTTPSNTIVSCNGDLLESNRDGRISKVSATENGVSTSSVKNPSRYSPPWNYLTETSDSTVAWKSLISAVNRIPGAEIAQVTDSYMHATVPSSFPLGDGYIDDLEFVLRPDDNLVLYRSASRTSIYAYPLTQPVSDRNTNLNRLEKIRTGLGWGLMGQRQEGSKSL
mmetsp:Transcript_26653/g.40748  ORF Transcript_26653/g.40748 Transcript_26653/m.40748 type:complete len:255 (+) Transcript_26653:404-1168(+)|eukprot:CAMPEP_0194081028 /NCGR_PEP_ID=MMETSP0149-20130528/6927_1 /TAXON_ID=122233 /ORGANISM="Chaetoceros debilis, Strain MM31A-1" /LENGTH=254 /DNA_ID=CAMNT_0038762871 /DNA_START=141 /DNA_END=905 /DNA_ORIENTATION=-